MYTYTYLIRFKQLVHAHWRPPLLPIPNDGVEGTEQSTDVPLFPLCPLPHLSCVCVCACACAHTYVCHFHVYPEMETYISLYSIIQYILMQLSKLWFIQTPFKLSPVYNMTLAPKRSIADVSTSLRKHLALQTSE